MLQAHEARQSLELSLCVTNITCLAVYLAERVYGARQSIELGLCVTNITCEAA